MKLNKIRTIKGKIKLVTGLHIGASKENIEIGGLDNPVIKDPLPESRAPYIPGSSLKGKIRSLLEISTGNFEKEGRNEGKPCGCGKCAICAVFGSSNPDNRPPELKPPRIVVRDCYLSREWKERFDRGDLPMEIKYENSINRIKGVAENPRPIERVPAGVEFDFNISFKKFDGDPDDYFQIVLKGMRMLELDALGGCGSRGSGQVRFVNIVIDGKEQDDNYLKSIEI